MEDYHETDHFDGFSSAHTGVTLDAEELARKLKAIGTEGRRRYYASPMHTEALPSPIFGGRHEGWGQGTHHDSNAAASSKKKGFPDDTLASRSPIRVINAEDDNLFELGCGEGPYRRSYEPNSLSRQLSSSSSSDTGLEGGSSSVWERDFFSTNSDVSEAFTTLGSADNGVPYDNHAMVQRKSKQRLPKQKLLSSPQRSPLNLYGNGYGRPSISYQGKRSESYDEGYNGLAHEEMGMGTKIDKKREWVGARSDSRLHSTRRNDGHNDANMHSRRSNDITPMSPNDTVMDSEWGGFAGSTNWSPSKPSPTSSMNSLRGQRSAEKYPRGLNSSGKLSPLWNHEQSFELPHLHYEPGQPKSKMVSSHGDQFSYMGCKERLLSGRASFEQSNADRAGPSEGEVKKVSNYDKFKLRQIKNGGNLPGNVHPRGSSSPELGLYGSIPNNTMPMIANLPINESYQSTPDYQTKGLMSERSPCSDRSRSSPNRKGGLKNSLLPHTHEEQGSPSWSSKETLKAVRDKRRDPGFQRFTTPATGGCVQSSVFDSFAMVKCSYDPKQDFKDSMVEMIFEKKLSSSYDMVELLQCYLTLNPARYHDTIVKVFTEVWSEVFQDV